MAGLVQIGHLYAWDYGYSYTKIAAKAAFTFQRQIMQSMAVAIHVAIGADDKTWQEFMKE